jgi:hypothetical protein
MRKTLLKFHIISVSFLIVNFLCGITFDISINYRIALLVKILFYLSGIVLFFLNLKPFKKIVLYFLFYLISPFLLLLSILIDGIFGGILISFFVFFISPPDVRFQDENIKIYKVHSGFLAGCCQYEITQNELLLLEKKIGEFKFEENLQFEKSKINYNDKKLTIKMLLKEYNAETENYYAKDSVINIPLKRYSR